MEWISVKDKLPEECINVLCYSANRGFVVDYYTGQIVEGQPEFYGTTWEWDFEVTHWCELPEPPKINHAPHPNPTRTATLQIRTG